VSVTYRCKIEGCGKPAKVLWEGQAFCGEHFMGPLPSYSIPLPYELRASTIVDELLRTIPGVRP